MKEALEESLKEVKRARNEGISRSELRARLHHLAEAHYEPAIAFFRTFLDDSDWDWRLEGVRLLGFHYLFAANSETIGKLKQLLLTDPSDFVRSSAAAALGSQIERMSAKPEWPDRALLPAMQADRDEQVRLVAFASLDRRFQVQLLLRAQIANVLENLSYLRFICDHGFSPSDSTLSEREQVASSRYTIRGNVIARMSCGDANTTPNVSDSVCECLRLVPAGLRQDIDRSVHTLDNRALFRRRLVEGGRMNRWPLDLFL